MRDELDKKLCEKYPKIFADRHGDMRNTAMCWGFDCGDGWYWLIDQLCDHIQSYIDSNPHLNIGQVVATQVKEKYGGLRFYYMGGDNHIDGMVSHTEYLSYRMCEECGTTENIGMTQGWLKTICRNCFDKSDRLIHQRKWVSREEGEVLWDIAK